MIADLISDSLKIRLITRNVMSVFSTKDEYTDTFLMKLKHSNYIINKEIIKSDEFIAYTRKTYNPYKNIYKYVSKRKDVRTDKFVEFLNYFGLNHLLWMHFYQLNSDSLSLVETLILLATEKPIVIINYLNDSEYKKKLYSLLFHVGLENRLIIIPCKDLHDAVNNSTCQCYVKNNETVKIQSTFSSSFLNSEFNTSEEYYNNKRPRLYVEDSNYIVPVSYTYTLYELFLIYLFTIKTFILSLNNWRYQLPCL